MEIKLTLKEQKKLVREAYENFPEASQGSSLACVEWHYRYFIFKFIDTETGKKYTVTLTTACKGLRLLLEALGKGELPGLGLRLSDITDTATWDAPCFDALAQMACFGEVVYG